MGDSPISQYFSQVFKIGALSFGRLLLSGLALIWVARELGPSEYGRLSFVLALINLLAIPFSGALNNFVVRETTNFIDAQDWRIGAIKSFAYCLYTIAWIYSIIALVVGWFIPLHLDWGLFSVAVFLVPFVCMLSVQAGVMRGKGFVVYGQSLEWFWQPLLYIIVLVVVSEDGKLEALEVVCAALAAYLFTSALGFYRMRLSTQEFIQALPCSFPVAWVGVWGRLALATGLGVANTNAATLFLGSFSTSDEVGYFGAAENLAALVSVPLSIFNVVIAAPIARASRAGNTVQLQRLAKTSSRAAFVASIVVIAVMTFFGRYIVAKFFGDSYTLAYESLLVLLIGHVVNVACGSVALILAMSGHEKDSLQALGGALVMNCVLCFFWVESWGSVGAAAASTIAMIGWNAIMTIRIRQRLNISAAIF